MESPQELENNEELRPFLPGATWSLPLVLSSCQLYSYLLKTLSRRSPAGCPAGPVYNFSANEQLVLGANLSVLILKSQSENLIGLTQSDPDVRLPSANGGLGSCSTSMAA